MNSARKETTMRIEKRLLLLIVLYCLAALPVLAAGDVRLLFGQKVSNEGRLDNAGVEDQALFGVMLNVDFNKPVALAVDLLWASDDDTLTTNSADAMTYFTEVDTIELDLGVRSLFRRDKFFKPYVGGGLAFIRMDALQTVSGSLGVPGSEFTDTILDDNDSGVGIWVDAGMLFQWKGGLNLGVDVRYSSAAVELSAVGETEQDTLDAGGAYYALTVGYAW